MVETLGNIPGVRTIRRFSLSDCLVVVMMASVMYLYFYQLSEKSPPPPPPPQTAENTHRTDHKARLEERSERVKKVCGDFNNSLRLEYQAIYYEGKASHPCTGTRFSFNQRNHFICNVLKGGSTSWDVFFRENEISNIKTFYCDYGDGDGGGGLCSGKPHINILQVRHPFERLVSTYRHVFKAGGWKSLDEMYSRNPRLEQLFTQFFNKSWTEFVEEVVIQNSFPITEDNLRNTVQHCRK